MLDETLAEKSGGLGRSVGAVDLDAVVSLCIVGAIRCIEASHISWSGGFLEP